MRSKLTLALVLIAAWSQQTFAATPFITETVDAAGDVGQYASLRLDRFGNPRIAYYDATAGDLKLASWSGSAWMIEIVDAGGTVGQYLSLALDVQGSPRISYYDDTSDNLKFASKNGGTWVIETVDATGDVGQYTSLALDAQGNPRIAYYDVTNTNLKYAAKSGAVWTIEFPYTGPNDIGRWPSIAIDDQGYPQIACHDLTDFSGRYVYKDPGGWAPIQTVDDEPPGGYGYGYHSSLVLDLRGKPHLSSNATNGYHRYSTRWHGGGWINEDVAGRSYTSGDYPSIALNAQGDPRIAYMSNYLTLDYAVKSGSAWLTETVDRTTAWTGEYSSLALDSQDNPSIGYYDTDNGDLKYADAAVRLLSPLGGERWAAGSVQTIRWRGAGTVSIQLSLDGGATYTSLLTSVTGNSAVITVPAVTTDQARIRVVRNSPFSTSDSPAYFSIAPDLANPWWATLVDGVGFVGYYNSLALDAQGAPRISYYDVTNGDLKLASGRGGRWTFEAVDVTGDRGAYNSIAIDTQGNPCISYWDYTNLAVRYASKSDDAWSLENVTPTGSSGQYSSLALDAQGNPRISYYDNINDDLKYASRNAGVWTIETPDATGDVGGQPSLALDSQGNPRVSYFDDTNDDLKYAAKNGGTWTFETVDGAGFVGSMSSLALDAQGNPCISYYDNTNTDLKFARKVGGVWTIEIVDAAGSVGQHNSLALDSQGNPRICYYDLTNFDLKCATKIGGTWRTETVDAPGIVGPFASLELDAQGNPHVSYFDDTNDDLRYASGAIELAEPAPNAVWPVGASRTVSWSGTGRVDLYLSVDGGDTWSLQQARLSGGEYRLQVPHTPTRFAKYKLERAVPYSVAISDLFTIETSVSLLAFAASLDPEGGATLSWNSDPGPQDLAGYRIERSDAALASGWRTVVPLTRATSHRDPAAGAGDRYRLFAVNGLGQDLLLGEASLMPARPLAAWPLPYRGGALTVSFASGGMAGAGGQAELSLFDIGGRRVRQLASGARAQGYHQVRWDGRSESGEPLPNGIYFLRLQSAGLQHDLKLAIVR